MKRPQDALLDLDRAIKIAPKNSYAYCSRGELYCKLRRYGKKLIII